MLHDHYSIPVQDVAVLVTPLRAELVALPEVSHKPVHLQSLLPWPWNEIFSESGFARLVRPDGLSRAKSARAYDSFHSEAERGALYRRLSLRRMMTFLPESRAAPLPITLFGLWKSPERTTQRLLADDRRSNAQLYTMRDLQEVYDGFLRSYPEKAHLMKCRTKVFDLVGVDMMVALPPGASEKDESDLANYFHLIEFPAYMQAYGRLGLVRAQDVGLDSAVVGEWVVPTLTTAPMGFVFSAVIAQVVHEHVMVPSLSMRIRYRIPAFETLRHRQRVADLSACAADGEVTLADAAARGFVPEDVPGDGGLSKVRIPLSAFILQQAPPSFSDAQCVVVQGYDLRDPDLAATMDRDRRACASLIAFVFFIYLDDKHSPWYQYGVDPGLFRAAANARHLLSGFEYERHGLWIHHKKWKFPHSQPTPSLGYVWNLQNPNALLYRCPLKLEALQVETDNFVVAVRRTRGFADLKWLQRLVSLWVHAMLPTRWLLSVFSDSFRVVHRAKTVVVFVSDSVCKELHMASSLAPFMVAESAPLCATVGAFDASNSGYGVAYRESAPENVLLEFSSNRERHGNWHSFSVDEDGLPLSERLTGRVRPEPALVAADFLTCDWHSDGCEWKVARAGVWRSAPRHITKGEALAAEMLLRWYASQPQVAHGRVCLGLGDNQPCLGGLAKGRSSARDLNLICRRVAAWSMCAAIRMCWLWIRSSANPADGPSRWRGKRRHA